MSPVDAYIAAQAPAARERLAAVRDAIRGAAPDAEETIGYGMPAYRLHGFVVSFAAFSRHIGLYPRASGIAAFRDALATYPTSAGAIRFPFDRPLPLALIAEITAFRVAENRTAAASVKTRRRN